MKKNKVIIKHLITPWNNIVYAADSVRDALTQRGRRLWWDTDGNLSREYYQRIISLMEEERFDRRLCHNEEGLLQGYWFAIRNNG